MFHAKGRAFAYALGGVQHLFHLDGADAVARCLQHFVSPTDEVKEAHCIAAHVVA